MTEKFYDDISSPTQMMLKVESVNALGWRCGVSDFEMESDFIEPQLMSEPLEQINDDESELNDAL